jgi:hypothetical protein
MLHAYSSVVNFLIGTGFIALFAAIFAAQAAAVECGLRIGLRRVAREGKQDKDGISTLTAGMLGLLGFTLGLTISFAQARYEGRRDSVLTEANAIGTAWLRSSLLADQDGRPLRKLIESYAQTRLAFSEAQDPGKAARASALGDAEQSAMWQLASSAARASPTAISASVIASLNTMIDAGQQQRFAYESGLPAEVGEMLLAGSLLALGAMGYLLGLDGQRRVVLTSLMLAMWAGGIAVTADLSSPRIGQIRATDAPLIWTIQAFSTSPLPAAH